MTEINESHDGPGWLLYDGECPLCSALAIRAARVVRPRGFTLATLQTPWVRERLGLRSGEPLTEMRVLTADGDALGGADALVYLAGRIWWAWPLSVVGRLPLAMPLLRRAYGWVARHRPRRAPACGAAEK